MTETDIKSEDRSSLAAGIHKLPVGDALGAMETGPCGLTLEEASSRQVRHGKNVIREKKGKPLILVFVSNFISLMAILLWIGGIIAVVADMLQLGIAIWLVNIINGVFSFWQEFRASKATEALKNMLPSYARVVRDGQELQILTEDLVPGDVVLLQEGDKISADCRLVDSSDLQVNQSTLTGESNPVRKTHEPVLRENLTTLRDSKPHFHRDKRFQRYEPKPSSSPSGWTPNSGRSPGSPRSSRKCRARCRRSSTS